MLLAMQAAAWRAEREQQRMLSLAWHVAALQRVKRLPSLATLLRPRRHAREKPIEEHRSDFEALKRAYNEHTARRSADTD